MKITLGKFSFELEDWIVGTILFFIGAALFISAMGWAINESREQVNKCAEKTDYPTCAALF